MHAVSNSYSLSLYHTHSHTHTQVHKHTRTRTLSVSLQSQISLRRGGWYPCPLSTHGVLVVANHHRQQQQQPSFLTDSHLLERERRNNNNNTINNNNINNNISFNKSVAETQDLRSSRKKFSRKLNRSRKRKCDCDLFEKVGFFCKHKKIQETLTLTQSLEETFRTVTRYSLVEQEYLVEAAQLWLKCRLTSYVSGAY